MSYTPIYHQSNVSLYNLIGTPTGTPVWFVDLDKSPNNPVKEVYRLVFNNSSGDWLLPIEVGMSYGVHIANLSYQSGIAIPAYIGGLADHVGAPERPEHRQPFQMWEISPRAIGKIDGIFNPSTQMMRKFRVVAAGYGESIAEAVFDEFGTNLNSEIVVYQREENVMRDVAFPKAQNTGSKQVFQESIYLSPATGLDEEERHAAYQTGKSYLPQSRRIALVHLVGREVVRPWLDSRYGVGNYSWTFQVDEKIGWWENQNFEIPASPYYRQTGSVHPQIPVAQKKPHRPQ